METELPKFLILLTSGGIGGRWDIYGPTHRRHNKRLVIDAS